MAGVRNIALAMVVGLASVASAQNSKLPPIDTDRPDFTDGTATIARGHLQLEAGYSYRRGAGENDHAHSLPEALVRFGLTPDVELRIGQNYLYIHPDAPLAESVKGLDDLYLGTKFRLAGQHTFVPAVSMEAFTTLPTGSEQISAHTILPGMALLWGWQIADPVSLGMELAGSRMADNYLQAAGSASLQVSATSRTQVFAEWYTFQPVRPPSGVLVSGEHYADFGLMYLLNDNLQLDARVGFGLNDNSDKHVVGIGVSIRH